MEEASAPKYVWLKRIAITLGVMTAATLVAGAGHGVYVMAKKNRETSAAGTGGAPSAGCPLPSWLGVK